MHNNNIFLLKSELFDTASKIFDVSNIDLDDLINLSKFAI